MNSIPFNKPFIVGKELHYVAQSVALGNISGDGPFTERCSRILEQSFGIAKVLMTPSCTAALEMAAVLCDLKPGDEVIMPSFTFVSTASAFVRAGAKPVFVDICPQTFNLDAELVEAAVTPRTRAICPVHYAGIGCDMHRLGKIAAEYGLIVVEDAAQAANATYRDRYLGSIGDLGCFSFHETKNFICGEGGALALNRPDMIERAEILRDKGTNRRRFLRGQVDKYTWVDVGSSYVPSEICCAFLCAQLEQMRSITARRRMLYERYVQGLRPLVEAGLLSVPHIPADRGANYHMFPVLVADLATRDELLAFLRRQAIQAVFHYIPLHSSPMGRQLGCDRNLPITDSVSERLVRLPLYFEITPAEQSRVVAALLEFFGMEAEAPEEAAPMSWERLSSASHIALDERLPA